MSQWLFLICLVFMDDWMIPLRSEELVLGVLATLHTYASIWSQTWALDKIKILCYNIRNPRLFWKFGNNSAPSVLWEKWLGVIFSSDRKWKLHYANRLKVARFTAKSLQSAGFWGGVNVPSRSLHVVRAMLWSSLDYGRAAAPTTIPNHLGVAKQLRFFQSKILREVLSLSKSAVIDGLIGETGDLSDDWRELKKLLSVAHKLLTAPDNSIPRTLSRAAYHSESKVGLIARAKHALLEQKANPNILLNPFSGPAIKVLVMTAAQRE